MLSCARTTVMVFACCRCKTGLLRWALHAHFRSRYLLFPQPSLFEVIIAMKTLNKSLLAAAVVGAIALPSLVSAANLQFFGVKQITYARDLAVNNDTMLETQDNLRLTATTPDIARVETASTSIKANEEVTVKLTLNNGARFDTTSNPETLVKTFREGLQTREGAASGDHGGTDETTAINYKAGTAAYSGQGQELTFVYIVTKNAKVVTSGSADNSYFLEINSTQVRNTVQSLGAGGSFDAEITVQNKDGTQVLAARQTIARSVWGLTLHQDDAVLSFANTFPDRTKRIDVGADPRKSLFSPTGVVGASTATAGDDKFYFNAGGFALDITKAARTNNGGDAYVINYNAVQAAPL